MLVQESLQVFHDLDDRIDVGRWSTTVPGEQPGYAEPTRPY